MNANALVGMTQERWSALSENERAEIRDLSGLSAQLVGKEGYRVEVVDKYGDKRRFIVGRSTGWRPASLEIKTRRSYGGMAADAEYQSVRVLYKAR